MASALSLGLQKLFPTRPTRRYERALLVLAALLFACGIYPTNYRGNDEVRYTQIADEMFSMEHGVSGFFLLHSEGKAYTQKPPLYFWLAAASRALFPDSALRAARVPSLISVVGILAAVLWLGRSLFGRGVALLAAALLLTLPQILFYGSSARLDGILVLCVTLALLAFWRIDREIGAHWKNLLLFYGAIGAALLTKGPVGLLLPWIGIVGYLSVEKRLFVLRRLISWWGIGVAVAPVLLWIGLAVALAPKSGDFFQESVVDNLYGRFFHGTSHAAPPTYYLRAFPKAFMPWALLWPIVGWIGYREVFSATASAERRRSWVFLLAWVLGAFLFFTLCSGKRSVYLLPVFPAVSLLCADALLAALAKMNNPDKLLRGVALGLIAVVGVAGIVFLAHPQIVDEKFFPFVIGCGALAVSAVFFAMQRLIPRDSDSTMRHLGLILTLVLILQFFGAIFLLPYYKTRVPKSKKVERVFEESEFHSRRANDAIEISFQRNFVTHHSLEAL